MRYQGILLGLRCLHTRLYKDAILYSDHYNEFNSNTLLFAKSKLTYAYESITRMPKNNNVFNHHTKSRSYLIFKESKNLSLFNRASKQLSINISIS